MSKEKLLRELKFIEDSFSSNIISKEEYDEAKKRIDDKLEQLPDEEIENPPKIEEHTVEVYHEPESEKQEVLEEPVNQPEPSNGLATPSKEVSSSDSIQSEKKKIKLETYGKSKKKPIILTIIALILIAIIFYSFSNINPVQEGEEVIIPICNTDLDCQKSGFVGICESPSTALANCTFQPPTEIEVTIIDDKDCKLCSTRRIKNTIKQIYPGASFLTVEKKDSLQLLNTLDIVVLPTVLFDDSLEETYRFDQTSSMVQKVGDFYVMKPQATGSPYFFKNIEKRKHIDLFIDPESSTSKKAYNNLIQLARLWDLTYNIYYYSNNPSEEMNTQICVRETEFFKNYMSCYFDGNGDCLENIDLSNCNSVIEDDLDFAESFFINSVPTFVVNNQYKKGGSLSVELLEELYCDVNDC